MHGPVANCVAVRLLRKAIATMAPRQSPDSNKAAAGDNEATTAAAGCPQSEGGGNESFLPAPRLPLLHSPIHTHMHSHVAIDITSRCTLPIASQMARRSFVPRHCLVLTRRRNDDGGGDTGPGGDGDVVQVQRGIGAMATATRRRGDDSSNVEDSIAGLVAVVIYLRLHRAGTGNSSNPPSTRLTRSHPYP
ncbi:hypothetical protein EDB85DRAFT_2222784 [Lactarius pseudohatsudake]|nr:hypothetical protein EDB85DRAFT_2222784 [Lactarius pseudohatsudake]